MIGRLLDASILFSFDRTGFRRHAQDFDPADTQVSLVGRTCLVTGANAGLGRATARALAQRGADVRLLCRNEERGRAAEADLRRATGSRTVRFQRLDVSRLADVRRFVVNLDAEQVDVLVHNAGVLPAERTETDEGLETTFATHVAGPHLLTSLLEPRLRAAPGARVAWVSSGGMYTRRLSCDDPDWRKRPYDGTTAYADTKRMQVVLAELWAENLRASGIRVHAMHPGWAETPGVRGSLPRFFRLMQSILRTPEQGADTIVWLCTAPRTAETTGGFWFDRAPAPTHLLPWTREPDSERQRLWDLCERTAAETARIRSRPETLDAAS